MSGSSKFRLTDQGRELNAWDWSPDRVAAEIAHAMGRPVNSVKVRSGERDSDPLTGYERLKFTVTISAAPVIE